MARIGKINKGQHTTKCKLHSGVGEYSSRRFSHHRSVLPDRNEAPKSATQLAPTVMGKLKKPSGMKQTREPP
jgi:hypothetical protein